MRSSWVAFACAWMLGCGAEPEPSPWQTPQRQLGCGFNVLRCLEGSAQTPLDDQLEPTHPGFNSNHEPDDYVGLAGTECELGFVYDLPVEKLDGVTLMLTGGWNAYADEPTLARCADYAATFHVYEPAAGETSGYRLVDHRTFAGKGNPQTQLCEEEIRSAGPGEAQYPRHQHIFLTPPRYARGLRVVLAALNGCEPLPLRFGVSQDFENGSEEEEELEPQ